MTARLTRGHGPVNVEAMTTAEQIDHARTVLELIVKE